jgi:hypothetical protein
VSFKSVSDFNRGKLLFAFLIVASFPLPNLCSLDRQVIDKKPRL